MKTIVRLSFIGAAASLAIAVWTFVGDKSLLPEWLLAIVCIGSFPLLFAAHRLTRKQRAGAAAAERGQLRHPDRVVVGVLAALSVTFVAALIAVAVAEPSPTLPPGQPQEIDGRYFVNSHGALTEITREQYFSARSGDQTLFAGVAYVFYCGATLIVAIPAARSKARGGKKAGSGTA